MLALPVGRRVIPDDPRSAALSALANFLVTEASVGETLHRVAEITLDALPAADMAGMSMLGDDGRPATRVYTDEASPEIDEGQYESGNGPCLDAWRQGRVVRVDDMEAAGADYPEFSRAALNHGVHSTISLPMVARERPVGALNLYARISNGFSSADETLARDLAGAAAAVLANSQAYWEAAELSEGLRTAMESRATIEQAKGMLMANTPGLDADGAYELLVRASQRSNVKLREVARRIVEREPPPSGA